MPDSAIHLANRLGLMNFGVASRHITCRGTSSGSNSRSDWKGA